MKNKIQRYLFSLITFLIFTPVASALAQATTETPEMADALRENGKIYVVVVAVTIIVAGMLAYLISLDRKVSRLERESKP